MTDDDSLHSEDDEVAPDESPRDDGDRRSLATLLAVAVVIIIIVLVLLMVRGCGSILNTANRQSSTNQIVPVPGRKPVDGSISVWVAAGTQVDGVLASASIDHTGIVDMGGGRFVVKVPQGTEVEAARRLKDVDGVYDAGRVYADDSAPATP